MVLLLAFYTVKITEIKLLVVLKIKKSTFTAVSNSSSSKQQPNYKLIIN